MGSLTDANDAGVPYNHFFNPELTVKQLLDLKPDSQVVVGHMVNTLWTTRTGYHHPEYYPLELRYFCPGFDVNGLGERTCDGIDECLVWDGTPI